MTATNPSTPALEVEDLAVEFRGVDGIAYAVRGISWAVAPGEVLAIVGESGSGKSATVQAIMGVLPRQYADVTNGSVRLHGKDLLRLRAKKRRRMAGSVMAMVPQDAIAALDPSMTVGQQMSEVIRAHQPISRDAATELALSLFRVVGIPDPRRRLKQYPHQFSGGMCQRVLIAMAICNEPAVLIADEPTTALDVTVQKQILDLLMSIKTARTMSVVMITHDLALVAEHADRIVVMYAGRIMEEGSVEQITERPSNPYTRGLLQATPRIEGDERSLTPIKGTPPVASRIPAGCSFNPRCPLAAEICKTEVPPLVEVEPGQRSACHFAKEVRG